MNKKDNLVDRLVRLKTREKVGDEPAGPILTPIEQKVKDLVDAATLVAIFKNESYDGNIVSVPKKAMDDLDFAIKNFSPKIWEQIQLERQTYLNFIGSIDEKKDASKSKPKGFKFFGN